MFSSVLIKLKKTSIYLLLLWSVSLYAFCNDSQKKDNPNSLHLLSVSTFDDRNLNFKISKDFLALDLGQMVTDSLPGFRKKYKNRSIRGSIKSRRDTNIVDVFTYCNNSEDDCVAVQKLVEAAFRDFEKLYSANIEFITKATELAFEHVTIIDKGKVDEFLELLPSDINAKDLKIIESQRNVQSKSYRNKSFGRILFGRINSVDSNLVNWITITLEIKNRISPEYVSSVFSQNFTYRYIDGELILSGFTHGSSKINIDHLPDLVVHPYAKTSRYYKKIRAARKQEREKKKNGIISLRNKFAPKYQVYLAKANKSLEQTNLNSVNPFTIKSDLEKEGKLHGKVKSILKMHFNANVENGKIVKGDSDCRSCNDFFDKYNEFGNQIEHITYNRGEVIEHYGYKYLEYEKQSFNYPNEAEVVSRDVFDKFGNQIVSYVYAKDSIEKIIFQQFDKEKKEIEKVVFDENYQYSTGWSDPLKTEYDYDDNGRILERRRFSEILNAKERLVYLANKSVYEYDEQKGEKIFTTEYDQLCNITGKDTFDQEKGTREFFEFIDNQFVLVKKFTFEYDREGNWTKAISYRKNRSEKNSPLKPVTIVEREIIYYQ